jgi:glutathione synthase/RimK-type ligase-like ATP-grasp enzyme
VFWRNFGGVEAEASRATRGSPTDIAHYDSMACVRSWFQMKNRTRWFNSWEAFQSHQEKPHQLALVATQGVRIPRTYVGNRSADVLAFCAAVPDAIFKPVYGGSHTERITLDHLSADHLSGALKLAPITLQEYIGGTNIRTYAIGPHCFSAELRSNRVDFRTDSDALIVPIETPPHIARQAAAIMQALHLSWTAIDWRRSEDGDYYFLEANPSPMFIGFEARSGFPITDTLIDCMTA